MPKSQLPPTSQHGLTHSVWASSESRVARSAQTRTSKMSHVLCPIASAAFSTCMFIRYSGHMNQHEILRHGGMEAWVEHECILLEQQSVPLTNQASPARTSSVICMFLVLRSNSSISCKQRLYKLTCLEGSYISSVTTIWAVCTIQIGVRLLRIRRLA